MKSILIDPFTRTIKEVEYDGDFHQIYEFIHCDTFDCVRVNENGDAIFVDDEGLISGKEQAFFGWLGYPQPLAGRGIVLGSNLTDGESADTTITLEEARELVVWLMPINIDGRVQFYVIPADETEH